LTRDTIYLDASAVVKLVVPETGSVELAEFLARGTSLATSVVASVEVPRAVARYHAAAADRTTGVLDAMTVIDLTRRRASQAAVLTPITLRSLDAIHLAAALDVGEDLACFVTYDRRLADAAREAGLPVASPGVDL
jgi:uncharacterized protein